MRRHLTYANVMASVAVFIALGGTATAALTITGKDVKNGSITSRDIKNRSLIAKDFKRGQLPRGATGAAGAAGAAGPAGAPGAIGPQGSATGWARVTREQAANGGGTGPWTVPTSKGLEDFAASADGLTMCLRFTQPPAGIVATTTSFYLSAYGGTDPGPTRCAGLSGANAWVSAREIGGDTAATAFDAFVAAY